MKVRVGFGQTISIGDYEMVKPSLEVEDEAQPGEDVAETYARIRETGEILFQKEVQRQLKLAHEMRKDVKGT